MYALWYTKVTGRRMPGRDAPTVVSPSDYATILDDDDVVPDHDVNDHGVGAAAHAAVEPDVNATTDGKPQQNGHITETLQSNS